MDVKLFQNKLLSWYGKNRRDLPWRRTKDIYAIWLSEVMLQQTQVKTVLNYYTAFLKQFPTIGALAIADEQRLLKSWEGLGYYSRIRNFKKAAELIVTEKSGQIPETFDQFHSLPGVGSYIAAAVLSIGFGLPYAVVDGNVKRVLSRLLLIESPVNEQKYLTTYQEAADRLLFRKSSGQHNQAMMELGALICTPQNPGCSHCPVASICKAKVQNKVDIFPRRTKKKKRTDFYKIVYVPKNDSPLLWLVKRPDSGLMAGFWELPSLEEEKSPQTVRENVGEEKALYLGSVSHIYTHRRETINIYQTAKLPVAIEKKDQIAWIISLKNLDDYPLSGITRKALDKYLENRDNSED